MDRLNEINARKAQIKSLLEDEKSDVNLEEIRSELESLEKEERELNAQIEKEERADKEAREERKKLALEVETRGVQIKDKEDNMNERKYTIADKEYRTAWAKKMMGLSEDRFTEEEKRALGDAVTTTASTFVAATASASGVNNGGLLVPTTLITDLLDLISQESPFFRDIRKLQVNGNVELPFLFSADDAKWVAEGSDTTNEGKQYKSIKLTGFELAKDIVLTWKVEEMSVESFLNFILDELQNKMGKALINAILYGTGSNEPTGVTNGITPVTSGTDPIDTIIKTYADLSSEERIGAKAYISTNLNIAICGYKDKNGNYPFLQGISNNSLVKTEVDPYLKDNDVVVGNARNYILNENTPIRVDREITVKGRKVTYGAYGIYDGNKKANAFAYGKYTPASSSTGV